MKSAGHNIFSGFVSLVIHAALLGTLCMLPKMSRKEKPRVLTLRLAQPPPAVAVAPEPPRPEPPKPEPPKPEPPKPEPPKVEPPKPEPPKVEPPKPKPVDPPKPLPPKKDTPKPKPVEPPKPVPPKTDTKKQSIADRLNQAKVVEAPKPQPKGPSLSQRLADSRKNNPVVASRTTSNVGEISDAVIASDTVSYAEMVVQPYIQRNWIQPVKGELDVSNPSNAEIEFTVSANGFVSNARIVRRSNSKVLNASVDKFLASLKRLDPLSKVNSKASSLKITVTMGLK